MRKTEGIGTSTQLHIDEIALKKGHGQFETVIYTERGVVDTMSGKKSTDLQVVLKAIPGVEKVKQVCMDMCASFADAVRKALPQAEIVLDRFHLVKLLNKKLDGLRQKTHRKLDKARQRRFLPIRFILFRDYRALQRDERRLLKEYLRLNGELKSLYWQCQGFRRILSGERGRSRTDVSNALMHWCDSVRKTLGGFVRTVESWWNETVNACLFPLNNGRAEGFNNKIKFIKRMGFGFRNSLNFKRRIQAACSP